MTLSRQQTYLLSGAAPLAVLLWFDVEWCLMTTFTAFSYVGLWLNTLLLALLLAAPAMLCRARKWEAVVVTLLAVWLECNLMYYRTYFRAIPLTSYALAGNLSDFTDSVTDSLRVADLGLLLIAAASWALAFMKTDGGQNALRRPYLIATGSLALLSGIWFTAQGGLRKGWEAMATANVYACRVPVFTPVGSLVYDYISASAPLSGADRTAVERFLAEQPRPDVLPDSLHCPQSLVLILCESLESWPIGLELEGKEVTPFLNSLVARDKGVFYAPRIVSQVGDGRSIDGQLLVNAGLYPLQTGVYAMTNADNTFHTLAKAIGGRSWLLSVDKPSTWNQQGVARAFGIDSLVMRDCWVNDEPVGTRHKTGDRSFMRQITEKMSRSEVFPVGAKGFVQVVTYSGHMPWPLPDSLDMLHLKGNYAPGVRDYLRTARYTDEALRILVNYLESRPDAENILIAITGDHEGLADRRREAASRHPFVSPEPLVPLIVVNAPVGARFDSYAGQVDLYPTLLVMTGHAADAKAPMGISLLSASHPRAAIGSDGTLYSTGPVPDSIASRLRQGRRVSDLIIRYNLLK